MITNSQSGTVIDEIADGIFRISTPVSTVPGGFTFNQHLIVDDEPLLFQTGPRRMFPLVAEAISAVMKIERLRYVGFSHVEADECGGLNDLLRVAPAAVPLCGRVAAMVSIADLADRAPHVLDDGASVALGRHTATWLDAPHMPHGWDCGFLFEKSTRTLLCGDLFTQGGAQHEAIVESDILEPSEQFRAAMDYYSHTRTARLAIEKLAATEPTTLACMHGSDWRGDGAALLRALGSRLE